MGMIKHGFMAFAGVAALTLLASPATQAADWFQLQNTEPAKAKTIRIWGFAQPTYEATFGDKVSGAAKPAFNGQRPVFNLIAPDHNSTSTFELKRARLGARGVIPGTDGHVNYFLLAEFADNGITHHASAVEMTDASITLNYIPGVRIRVGQFKYPGPEEAQQAFPLVDPFIEFSTVTKQLILGRSLQIANGASVSPTGATRVTASGGVDAFRDTGIEVFDWYDWKHWEVAYGVMLGNGSTINAQDDNSNKQWSARVQGSYVFGGKGPYRQDVTGWLWYQTGKRSFGNTDYSRRREGVGVIVNYKPFRASAAYLRGTGVIFDGIKPPFNVSSIVSTQAVALGSQNKARGWYVEGEYALPMLPKASLEARFDTYDRLPNNPTLERHFHTWTVGAQYAITPKVKLRLNYLIQSLKPGNSAAAGQNARAITDAIGNMLAAQVLVWF